MPRKKQTQKKVEAAETAPLQSPTVRFQPKRQRPSPMMLYTPPMMASILLLRWTADYMEKLCKPVLPGEEWDTSGIEL